MRTNQNFAKRKFFIFCTKMEKNAKAIALVFFRPQKSFYFEFNGNCSLGAFGRADDSAAIGFELARFLFEIGPCKGPSLFLQ